ncbi:MAG TPA: lipopolysaccharide biosynthesis protein [Gemmatimonadaceae bacterium]|nr:lipopolysaccharide biosynthesis protein [Gemmatimonadaceae bacterium]
MTIDDGRTLLDPTAVAGGAASAARPRASPIAESAVLAAGRVGAAAVAMVLPIALVRVLDPASVGRYKLFFLIASTLGTLLSFGIPASLYYYVPRHPASRQRMIATAIGLLVLAGLAGAVIIVSARPLLATRFDLADHREVLLAALFTAVSIPAALLPVLATTDGRVGLASLAIAGFDVLRATAMVSAALVFRRVDAVLAAAAAVMTLQLLALGTYLVAQRKPAGPKEVKGTHSVVRRQLGYAASYQGAIVANLVREQAHAYYVAANVSTSAYAIYAVGLLQVPFLGAAAHSLNDVLIVHGSEMHGRGEIDPLVSLWHRSAIALASVAFPVFVTLWLFAPDLFRVLFGATYGASVPVFRLSLLLQPLSVPLLHTMLRATGRTGAAARAEIVSLVVAVGSLPLLVHRVGPLGAVTSLVLASVAFQLTGSRVLLHELRRTPATLLPWRSLASLLSAAVASAVGARVLATPLPPVARLALGIPTSFAAYLCIAWRMGLVDAEDRARLQARIARLSARWSDAHA